MRLLPSILMFGSAYGVWVMSGIGAAVLSVGILLIRRRSIMRRERARKIMRQVAGER